MIIHCSVFFSVLEGSNIVVGTEHADDNNVATRNGTALFSLEGKNYCKQSGNFIIPSAEITVS